jgi:hypothetical protein
LFSGELTDPPCSEYGERWWDVGETALASIVATAAVTVVQVHPNGESR